MKAAIYARVSTEEQFAEQQVQELRDFCFSEGHDIIEVFVDHETGDHDERDAFQAMFAAAAQHKFDILVFWALDRFSREGVFATFQHLQKLTVYKIDWVSYKEPFFAAAGEFKDVFVALIATTAKQERRRISERTKVGMALARLKGSKIGHYSTLNEAEVLTRWRAGEGLQELAAEKGLTKMAAWRAKERALRKEQVRQVAV